ncbi:hypothetical protein BC829DRAFT_450313 [Chytridium lagenaria]|nr:hypothetical protein BC829DRAFT_450313 [Chytridium lagenaria]
MKLGDNPFGSGSAKSGTHVWRALHSTGFQASTKTGRCHTQARGRSHMTVNVINNGNDIEYKIYPVTLKARAFMDRFSTNRLNAVNQGVLGYFPQNLNSEASEEYSYIIPLPEPVESMLFDKRHIYRKVVAPGWSNEHGDPVEDDSDNDDPPEYEDFDHSKLFTICQPVAT